MCLLSVSGLVAVLVDLGVHLLLGVGLRPYVAELDDLFGHALADPVPVVDVGDGRAWDSLGSASTSTIRADHRSTRRRALRRAVAVPGRRLASSSPEIAGKCSVFVSHEY